MKESHTKQKGDSNHASRFGHEDVLICGSDMIQSKGASQVLQELLNKHSFDSYLVHTSDLSHVFHVHALQLKLVDKDKDKDNSAHLAHLLGLIFGLVFFSSLMF